MPENQPGHPDAQNPEIGIGDLMKFFQVLTEAVLTGSTERPAISIRIAGKTVTDGPSPIKIK